MPAKEITAQPEVAATTDELFVPAKKALLRRGVKVFVWGPYGVGKTHFALSFPEPIYVISTEFGVAQLLHQFPNKDIRIMECTEPYTDAPIKAKTGEVDDQPFAVDPILSLRKVEKATEALKDITKGTIVLDSGSDIWQWMGAWLEYNYDKATKSGQMMRTEWGKANARYKWILMRLLSRPVHFVLTSRSQNVYDSQGAMTQQEKFKAQAETPYFADIIIHMSKKAIPQIDIATGKVTGMTTQRIGEIEKCRFADITPTINDPTFDALKAALSSKVPAEVFG